jgi:hypothetical protein
MDTTLLALCSGLALLGFSQSLTILFASYPTSRVTSILRLYIATASNLCVKPDGDFIGYTIRILCVRIDLFS